MGRKDSFVEDERDGVWQDSDKFESDVEYQDMYDDTLIETLQEDNPELLELMKKAGLEVE